tara:strand:- start:1111 stop:1377 length:267 start_codon:yes stop_codon:yes gene_type:complete
MLGLMMKIKTLVKKALKNGYSSRPCKGMMYLRDIPLGKMFETKLGTRGVLINCNVNAQVVILSVNVNNKDAPYYLGKRIIGAETEVYK